MTALGGGEMTALQVTWFVLVGVLLTGYALLDGFDLGVGLFYLGARGDRERRLLLNAVGPVWDGNEVWLLTGGGALFAAFPPVYATVFSGFYLAMMLVLLALILRAVAIEFRGKVDHASWKGGWDRAFAVGSVLAALLFGVAVGNVLRGVPLDADGNFAGSFVGLLNPYALLAGLLGLAMVATHGALYIALKTDGSLAARARGWAAVASVIYLLLFVAAACWTVLGQPHLVESYARAPVLWALPGLAAGGMVAIQVFVRRSAPGKAFAASCLSIVALMATAGAGLFPRWVPARGDLSLSLTISNSSSSEKTLGTMLVLAGIGMPMVIAYTVYVYRTFSGKVVLDETSY
jgi:cytochrome d ubiquinol oxidase subunit II